MVSPTKLLDLWYQAEGTDDVSIYKNVSQSLVYKYYNSIDRVNATECFTASNKLLKHLCCAKYYQGANSVLCGWLVDIPLLFAILSLS